MHLEDFDYALPDARIAQQPAEPRDSARLLVDQGSAAPLHRHVRHPWYSLGLLILWTRDMDEARLTSALCITLYLWLGSLLEEEKLLAFHGEAYARYRARVPGLIPWPGRSLDADEARALCALRRHQDDTTSTHGGS